MQFRTGIPRIGQSKSYMLLLTKYACRGILKYCIDVITFLICPINSRQRNSIDRVIKILYNGLHWVPQKNATLLGRHITFVQLRVLFSNFLTQIEYVLQLNIKFHLNWLTISNMVRLWNCYIFLENSVCTLMELTTNALVSLLQSHNSNTWNQQSSRVNEITEIGISFYQITANTFEKLPNCHTPIKHRVTAGVRYSKTWRNIVWLSSHDMTTHDDQYQYGSVANASLFLT